MTGSTIRFSVIALASLYSSGTYAADAGALGFSFNGFGTLGVVHSDEDKADFVSNGRQSKGAGFSNSWTATPDSKLGLQLTGHLTDRFSAVIQVVSQYQHDGSFTPYLEWANLRFQVTPNFNVRVGRIAIPTFLFSDSVNVGYALPYVRIPLEIYSELPVTNSDGIDGSYRFHVGDVTNSTQVFVGRFDSKAAGGGIYNVRDQRGISDTIEFGPTTLHISYQTLVYDLRVGGFFLDNDPESIATIGATHDPGKWYVSGEWTWAKTDALGKFQAGYVIGGYRIASLTPYLSYARAHMTEAGSLGPSSFQEQDTRTVGVRWDFASQWDLKLQLDNTARHGGDNIFFLHQQPGFDPFGTGNVFSMTVDVVF